MKKIIFLVLISMFCISVEAKSHEPQYKIIANSNQETDIKEMYTVKNQLLKDYKEWVKGVDDKDQVLADHQSDYHAQYDRGTYIITLGEGKGKTLSGELKVNYCESTSDIETKSLFFGWLFS